MQKSSKKLKLVVSTLTLGVMMLFTFSQVALGALNKDVQFNQSINYDNNFLELDVVDGSDVSVANPSLSFSDVTYDFADQNSTAVLGDASQKLRVTNKRQTETWI